MLTEDQKQEIVVQLREGIKTNDFEHVKEILDTIDISSTVDSSSIVNSVLHYAIRMGNAFIVELLLNSSIDSLEYKDGSGLSPVNFAAMNGNLEIVQLLHEKGADLSTQDKLGNTPLHHGIGDINITCYLLANGANPNATNKINSTPSHSAVFSMAQGEIGYYPLALLAKTGAKIIGDQFGSTPADIARQEIDISVGDYINQIMCNEVAIGDFTVPGELTSYEYHDMILGDNILN